MVPDITATPPAEGPQRVPIRKGRVSGESEKVSPGRLGRTPLPVLLVCLCNTQLGATPEARRRGARAPALAWPGTSGKHRHGGRQHHTGEQQQSTRQRRQRVSTDSFCVFVFWGSLRRPVALVAGPGPSPVRWRSRPSAPVGSGAAATPAEQHQRPQHRTEHRHRQRHRHGGGVSRRQRTEDGNDAGSGFPTSLRKEKKEEELLGRVGAFVAGAAAGWRLWGAVAVGRSASESPFRR